MSYFSRISVFFENVGAKDYTYDMEEMGMTGVQILNALADMCDSDYEDCDCHALSAYRTVYHIMTHPSFARYRA